MKNEQCTNSKDEYLMLRDEILHLDLLVNNTINFFYVFVSAVLLYSLKEKNVVSMLISYIVIIPAYIIAMDKTKNMYKIGAYLRVFHEGNEFNWETRNAKLYQDPKFAKLSKMSAFNLPFLFVSSFVTILFMARIDWNSVGETIEFLKVVIAIILYSVQLILIIKNGRIKYFDYVEFWEKQKN